jgi:hypothetical protein
MRETQSLMGRTVSSHREFQCGDSARRGDSERQASFVVSMSG